MSIPTKYLSKMGDYEIILDDIPLTAKVVDDIKVMEELIPSFFGSEEVFGIDLVNNMLVICGQSKCLILLLKHMYIMVSLSGFSFDRLSDSLKEFLQNSENCFVRPSKQSWSGGSGSSSGKIGVPTCELAARVFKKPALFDETRFGVIAREVNVSYSPGSKPVEEFKNERILTPLQVKMVIYDAFTCYRIASKLLATLH
ncbi:putative pre-16S rRNA nuclease [Bienertia sinuspersici]